MNNIAANSSGHIAGAAGNRQRQTTATNPTLANAHTIIEQQNRALRLCLRRVMGVIAGTQRQLLELFEEKPQNTESEDNLQRPDQELIDTRIALLLSNGCTDNGLTYSIAGCTITHTQAAQMPDHEFTRFLIACRQRHLEQTAGAGLWKQGQEAGSRKQAHAHGCEDWDDDVQRPHAGAKSSMPHASEWNAATGIPESDLPGTEEIEHWIDTAHQDRNKRDMIRPAQIPARHDAERQQRDNTYHARIAELRAMGLTEHQQHFAHPDYRRTGIEKQSIAIATTLEWEEIIELLTQRIAEGILANSKGAFTT
jgi:hypothetical protein